MVDLIPESKPPQTTLTSQFPLQIVLGNISTFFLE